MKGFVNVRTAGSSKIAIDSYPYQTNTLTYTGEELTPEWANYDSSLLTIGGTYSATDAGTYTVTFTPVSGYCWSDGTNGAYAVSWTINRAYITVPAQSGTLTYSGAVQSPTWDDNYDSAKMTLGGTTSATDAGSYNATFTPTSNYQWTTGETSSVTVSWTISKATVTVPAQSGTLTYTGSAQSPTWDSNYESAKMTISGTTSATDAGSYTVSFTPGSNYMWTDGTSDSVSVTWTISKATGSVSISTTSMTLDASTLTGTITVTRSGDGTVSATSSDTGVATVSVSDTTVTVTAVANGTATITISVAAGTNYTAPGSVTCSVTVSLVTELADCTPSEIQSVAQDGTASTYWTVGDTIGITLSGTVGSLSISGTYYAFIIGFDHNSTYEGSNTIHFQFGKTSDGTDIAFVDDTYGSSSSSACFHMNSSNTNSGGWSSSYMRSTICPAFLSAMPSSWQSVISACTKYTDNTGSATNTAACVTSTSDSIWLLAEYEVTGSSSYANSYEYSYQAQYDYYANGNSKIKYKHSDTSTACVWWLRSPRSTNSYYFCNIDTSGSISSTSANYSRGFAPGFKVA